MEDTYEIKRRSSYRFRYRTHTARESNDQQHIHDGIEKDFCAGAEVRYLCQVLAHILTELYIRSTERISKQVSTTVVLEVKEKIDV
jgi:hypothetical protein